MRPPETQLDGSQEGFPDTPWTSMLSPEVNPVERQKRLHALCDLYWRPVYRFVRASWDKPVEDSKDLTQEFFCRLLEGDLLSQYRSKEGRFRYYLKGVLKHFLWHVHRDGNRQKRGGGKRVLSLDVAGMESDRAVADGKTEGPEEAFDRQWANDVIAQSLTRLRASLQNEGREAYFKAYAAYELDADPDKPPTYEEVAKQLNLSVHDVANYLYYTRTRLQKIVRDSISEYVSTSDEIVAELQELFSG